MRAGLLASPRMVATNGGFPVYYFHKFIIIIARGVGSCGHWRPQGERSGPVAQCGLLLSALILILNFCVWNRDGMRARRDAGLDAGRQDPAILPPLPLSEDIKIYVLHVGGKFSPCSHHFLKSGSIRMSWNATRHSLLDKFPRILFSNIIKSKSPNHSPNIINLLWNTLCHIQITKQPIRQSVFS